jgi:hypothetical protein
LWYYLAARAADFVPSGIDNDERLVVDVDVDFYASLNLQAARERDNRSALARADTQQLRMLERLRRAGTQPVTLGELRGGGIAFPAEVISELALHGYAIERVYEHGRLIGVRLLSTEAPDTPASRRRHRWRWRSR